MRHHVKAILFNMEITHIIRTMVIDVVRVQIIFFFFFFCYVNAMDNVDGYRPVICKNSIVSITGTLNSGYRNMTAGGML
nr:MAG TPA: hypothetical protein [Bacteriophage sp.]